jgi:hypothetical protein
VNKPLSLNRLTCSLLTAHCSWLLPLRSLSLTTKVQCCCLHHEFEAVNIKYRASKGGFYQFLFFFSVTKPLLVGNDFSMTTLCFPAEQ